MAKASAYERDVTTMEGEKSEVNLYDGHYSEHSQGALTKVRIETYGGEAGDLGQSSWMTTAELEQMMSIAKVTKDTPVLEIGCGCGGTAIWIAKKYGCHVMATELNPHGLETGKKLAAEAGLSHSVSFQLVDGAKPLPFDANSYNVVFCNDTMCHIPNRAAVLDDWKRVLKPGGFIVYTDAMVVTGPVSSDEFKTRASIGKYYYQCLGSNEKAIKDAGLSLVEAIDTSGPASQVAKRWHDARAKYKQELNEPEGNYQGLQKFTWTVHTLLKERRLSRYMYVASKPASKL
jgi:ubiquinone/menaquinone biosynthesis C-methylase UbiE